MMAEIETDEAETDETKAQRLRRYMRIAELMYSVTKLNPEERAILFRLIQRTYVIPALDDED